MGRFSWREGRGAPFRPQRPWAVALRRRSGVNHDIIGRNGDGMGAFAPQVEAVNARRHATAGSAQREVGDENGNTGAVEWLTLGLADIDNVPAP